MGHAWDGWKKRLNWRKKKGYIYIYRVEQNDPVCGTKWSIEFITFALGLATSWSRLIDQVALVLYSYRCKDRKCRGQFHESTSIHCVYMYRVCQVLIVDAFDSFYGFE